MQGVKEVVPETSLSSTSSTPRGKFSFSLATGGKSLNVLPLLSGFPMLYLTAVTLIAGILGIVAFILL